MNKHQEHKHFWKAGITSAALGLGLVPVVTDSAEAASLLNKESKSSKQNASSETWRSASTVGLAISNGDISSSNIQTATDGTDYVSVVPHWPQKLSTLEEEREEDGLVPVNSFSLQEEQRPVLPEAIKLREVDRPVAYNPEVVFVSSLLEESSQEEKAQEEDELVIEAIAPPEWLQFSQQISYSPNNGLSWQIEEEFEPVAESQHQLRQIPLISGTQSVETTGSKDEHSSDSMSGQTDIVNISEQLELDENWISTTLEVLERNNQDTEINRSTDSETASDRPETDRTIPRLAVSSSGISDPSRIIYDIRALPDAAITPTDLASSIEEEQISVSAEQIEIVTPVPGTVLNIPSTPIALSFPVGARIALLINGKLVDPSQIGRTETNPETQLRIQTWYGVSLSAGENLIEVVSTETGEVFASSPIVVRGQPKALNLFAPQTLPADGISTATIRGQLVDDVGIASKWNTTVTLNASAGRFLGADQNPDQPGFQVPVVDGSFSAELQSSLSSRLVQLQATTSGFEAFRQIQFQTPQRPSLVSGVIDLRFGAGGSDYYDSYREFLPINGDNSYEFDIDSAVFATGNIGEWLYTGAYNSDRALNENCRGESTLFRASSDSDCINSYATYGDDSSTDVITPSLDSIYLRLERDSPTSTGIDYAMWGDFNTEEFATSSQLFTATNRQLHGFKTNYNFGNLSITGLYANNVEGFQRDTIAPDGTSGFYFTSQRDLVPGSETVYLELEELERPGTVLDRQLLSRGGDYEIDYDRGTLLFKDPIMRTMVAEDGLLLVRRIVATYQHEDGNDTDIYAGRLRYSFGDALEPTVEQSSWIGASYLSEDQGTRDFTLYGIDAQIALGDNTKVVAEIAQSDSNFAEIDSAGGTAYRVEIDSQLNNAINGSAYYRSTTPGFSNVATTSFVPGQTRYGAQLTGQIGEGTALRARYDRETNDGTAPSVITDVSDLLSGIATTALGTELDNTLTTYSLGISQKIGRANAEFDWIHRDRTDRINEDFNASSDQLRTRVTAPISRKLSVVAQNEINLSSEVDPIYPSRTLIGLNWEAMPWLNVGLNQIFYGGGGNSRGSYTSLDVTGEHTFASDTTIRGRFSTTDGRQVGGTIGLEQGINLAPGLDLDLSYEKVFSTFGNETAASTQFSQPVAVGTGASALGLAGGESYSIGLSYTDSADFQASTRFEHRSSARSSNTVFNVSALGRLSPALTVLGDYRLARAANQSISGLGTTSLLKLGLAYRKPEDDKFNALLRYEHRTNPNSIPASASVGSSTDTQEHLFSAEAIYAPNWRWELYGKYALRNSRTAINVTDSGFSSSQTAQLAQARATYRLGYRWDVVGEARWIGGSGFNETGYSVEGGYYPLPDLRISAGYSGGAVDTDFGDNRSTGGFYVGMTAKLSGLLSGFGTQPRAPYQQTESAVTVSQEASPFGEAIAIPEKPTEDYPAATEL